MALTPKQERFCQEIVSGKSQADAYRAAFNVRPNTKPSSVQVSASQLMADPKVAQRVAELREPIVRDLGITLEGHLNDLLMLRNIAAKSGQLSAAINAEVARAKAAGVSVDKLKISGDKENPIVVTEATTLAAEVMDLLRNLKTSGS